ncbi:MAG: aldo/keto reductase [Candidatus Marinimicrobia bacterium]|nr:aldo/keto reductase [Candidatus Neomarinimicrobiota bacterium]
MKKIILGRTNQLVSAISLGTWSHGGPNTSGNTPVGWTGYDEDLAYRALLKAWEVGINHWDTADVYGNGRSEQLIGRSWKTVRREDIFLTSKVGWFQGDYPHYYHPDLMRQQLEQSLRNLCIEQIDLYYFHHCLFGKQGELLDGAMETMLKFRDEGKIRYVGLSDWDLKKIMRVVDKIDPDVIQPYRNVHDDAYQSSGLKDWVDTNNVGVAFFSPLRHGLLTGKYTAPTEFPAGDFRSNVVEFGDANFIRRMQENKRVLEEKFADHAQPVLYGLTGALLSDAATGCVLLGQRNPDQVAAVAALGTSLSEEDARWVFDLYR